MRRHLSVLLAAWLATGVPVYGQAVQQSGTVTPKQVPVWVTSGVIGGSQSAPSSAANSVISSFGVTNNGGSGICVNSALPTSLGYQALCLGASTNGPATISLQNFGTASPQPLQFVIDGVPFPFPGSLANITIGTTPVVGGTNSLCLFVSGGVVGQQACTLSAITSLTGDVTAVGPGISAATLAAVNGTPGTFGSGALVPIITVNAKGLITNVSTSPFSITVGSSGITSGINNGLLYDNGGILGNLNTLSSGVLVTSAGGVPSIATTLPSGLTIPGPTFSGTVTFPDSATWTSSGISKVSALSAGSATIPSAGNINVSGQYQVSGSQIAASNLSNGTTGSGAIVLAASPTLSGTVGGNLTLSGNITHSGQAIHTGTSAPASSAGNTVVMGTIAAPTLAATAQGFIFNTVINGLNLEGDGSTNDVSILNNAGGLVFGVPTGSTKLNFPSLANGTCSAGLALDAGNNTVLTSCPGASSSIQVGTTSITSGTSGFILFNNVGVLGNESIATALGVRTTLPTTSVVTSTSHTGGFSANASGTYTTPANVLWIDVTIIGGGAGGGGGGTGGGTGTAGNPSCWNTTGAACTSPVFQAGGGAGGSQTTGGAGGTVSGSSTCNLLSIAGGGGGGMTGGTAAVANAGGGGGGSSSLGGGGVSASQGATTGGNGAANSGGGGGGGSSTGTVQGGGGGGAGATCHTIITSPGATFTYVAGATAAGGTAGTGGAGGAGAGGQLIVIEHYGS